MADIQITADDLSDPRIDDQINLQKSLQQRQGEFIEDIRTPFYYNPVFYYSVAGLIGGLIAWSILEPLMDEGSGKEESDFFGFIFFGLTAALIGTSQGIAYGISNRNFWKLLLCGTAGMGIGLLTSLLTAFLAGIAFVLSVNIAAHFINGMPKDGEYPFHGMSFFLLMCGRGLAWAIASLAAGLGLGIALKSKKLVLNGLVGALVGGMIGGLLFDPIDRFLTDGPEAAVSRGVAIAMIGLLVGFFTGLFENISKEAWLLMVKGPLTGKQFNIFKSPMIIGSSPKSDVYLFKDPDIDPKHATVSKSGTRYTLKDEGAAAGVYVNGKRIQSSYLLQNNDTITIGGVVLRYVEKAHS